MVKLQLFSGRQHFTPIFKVLVRTLLNPNINVSLCTSYDLDCGRPNEMTKTSYGSGPTNIFKKVNIWRFWLTELWPLFGLFASYSGWYWCNGMDALCQSSRHLEIQKLIQLMPRHDLLDSFPASGDFCCVLITYANSLDPNQARHIVGPDLDPNSLTLW